MYIDYRLYQISLRKKQSKCINNEDPQNLCVYRCQCPIGAAVAVLLLRCCYPADAAAESFLRNSFLRWNHPPTHTHSTTRFSGISPSVPPSFRLSWHSFIFIRETRITKKRERGQCFRSHKIQALALRCSRKRNCAEIIVVL